MEESKKEQGQVEEKIAVLKEEYLSLSEHKNNIEEKYRLFAHKKKESP